MNYWSLCTVTCLLIPGTMESLRPILLLAVIVVVACEEVSEYLL